MLKHETLARLGYEGNDKGALVEHSDTRSIQSSKSGYSNALKDTNKPRAIDYLTKGREQKESVRDFI